MICKFKFIAAIISLLIVQSQAVITGNMYVEPRTIAEVATYTFEVSIKSPMLVGGYFELEFSDMPDPFQATQIASTLPCQEIYGFSTQIRCTVITTRRIKIEAATNTVQNFSSEYDLVFKLTGFNNPGVVSTFNQLLFSYDDTGRPIEQSGGSMFKFSTEPGLLETTLTSAGSVQVAAYTDLQVQFTVKHDLTSSQVFVIELPKWNSGTQQKNLELPMFNTLTLTFEGAFGGYNVPCASSTPSDHPNLKCILQTDKPSTILCERGEQRSEGNVDRFIITNFGSTISKNVPLTVVTKENKFWNPPSTRPVNSFRAFTKSSTIQQLGTICDVIDSKISGISYAATEQVIIPSSSVTLQSESNEINVKAKFDFVIKLNLPLPVGTKIKVKIPKQLQIAYKDEVYLTSAFSKGLYPQVRIIDAATQEIEITRLVPDRSKYIEYREGFDEFVTFSLLDLKNPASIAPTDEFEIEIWDQNYRILTVDKTGLVYKANPGALQDVSVTVKNYRTREKQIYNFSFLTKNDIVALGFLHIQVPKEIEVDATALTLNPISIISRDLTTRTISWDAPTRTIKVANAYNSNQIGQVKVEFQLTSGLQNAASSKPTGPFIVSTLGERSAIIDSGPSQPMVFTANEITKIETTACSEQQTASQTDEICTYKLRFFIGPKYPIASGSAIKITLPNDLEFGNITLAETNSTTDGLADLSSNGNFKVTGKDIEVKNAFVKEKAPDQINFTWIQDSFSILIAGIRSPRSTAPTLSFKAYINGQDGYPQFKKEQGVYSNVYQAKRFRKTIIARSNEVNGDNMGAYNFTMMLSSEVKKNEYAKITPPQGITIESGRDQCEGFEPLQSKLACIIKEGSLFVQLNPIDTEDDDYRFGSGDILTIRVKNFQNAISLEPTGSFGLYISTDLDADYKVNQMVHGLNILNTIEGALTNVQVLPDSNKLSVKTDYSIYFTTANDIPRNSYIEIEFPAEYFKELGSGCKPIRNIDSQLSCNIDGNIIRTNGTFNDTMPDKGEEIGIKLFGVLNPPDSVPAMVISKQFRISTLTEGGFPIDRAHNLQFTIGCNYPCQSCEKEQSRCTSCQSLPTKPGQTPRSLYLFESTCNIDCPAGRYPDEDNVCQLCAQQCGSCATSKDVCDSCLTDAAGEQLFLKVGKCVASCGEGYYKQQSTATCAACPSQCATCMSKSECLSCKEGLFFVEPQNGTGQCEDKCPATSILFKSAEVQECQACKVPCLTCEGATDQCTTCQPNFVYFAPKKQCLTSCPVNYAADAQSQCYLAKETVAPFVTLIGTVLIILLVAVSRCWKPQTRIYNAFLALEGAYLVFFWIYMLVFLIKDYHKASATMIGIALINNYIINLIWYNFYKERVLTQQPNAVGGMTYGEYKNTYKCTQKTILIFSLLTTFQLFRMQYCLLFGADQYNARFELTGKLVKRMNRYSLFQITFVYVLSIFASCYNLFYTWPGRQLYWIDIENIVACVLMSICIFIVIVRSQDMYGVEKAGKRVYQIPVNENVEKLAEQLNAAGGANTKVLRDRIGDMNPNQRRGIVQKVFAGLFYRNRDKAPAQEGPLTQHVIRDQHDDFVLKHGREVGLNEDGTEVMASKNDPTQLRAYQSAMPRDAGYKLKAAYSSSRAEGGKRNLEGQVYEKANNTQDVTNENMTTLLDNTGLELDNYAELKQETTQMEGDNNEDLPDLQRQRNTDLTLKKKQVSKVEEDAELFNFQSAPYNADSACRGNQPLQDRHAKLMQELDGKRNKAQPKDKQIDGTAGKVRDDTHVTKRHGSTTSGLKADQLFKHLPYQSAGGQKALQKVYSVSEIRPEEDSGDEMELDSRGQVNLDIRRQLDDDVADSDDLRENFTSSQWGEGASKIIATHYNTTQNRKYEPAKNKESLGNEESQDPDESTVPKKIQYNKLNPLDFRILGHDLAKVRQEKNLAKRDHNMYIEEKIRLEHKVEAEDQETVRLKGLVDDLKAKIDAQMQLLTQAKEKKAQEINFIENANFTSNEDAMGVSPNAYVSQNRMPQKPGTRHRSPVKEAPVGAESSNELQISSTEKESGPIVMPGLRVIQKKKNARNMDQERHRTVDPTSVIRHKPGAKTTGNSRDNSSGPMGSRQKSMPGRTKAQQAASRMNATDTQWKNGDTKKLGESSSNTNLVSSRSNKNKQLSGSKQSKQSYGHAKVVPYVSDSEQKSNKANQDSLMRRTMGVQNSHRLKQEPLINDKDDYEYYTSVDGQGKRVQKLRKIKRDPSTTVTKKGGKGRAKTLNRQPAGDSSGNLQTTSQDERGRNPRIRTQNSNQVDTFRSRSQRKSNQKSDRKSRNNRGGMSISNDVDADAENSYMGEAEMMKSRRKHRQARSQAEGKQQSRTFDRSSKRKDKSGSGTRDPAVWSIGSDGKPRTKSTMIRGAPQVAKRREFPIEMKNQAQDFNLQDQRSDLLGDPSDLSKVKRVKVKKQKPKDFSGVYFNHTNFEKAVIATNGRAPYNNKEVEVISNQNQIDPNSFNFKNNWVQNIDKNLDRSMMSNNTSQQRSASKIRRNQGIMGSANRGPSGDRMSDAVPSASVTATTVFQGLANPSIGGYMGSEYRGAPSYQALPESPPNQTNRIASGEGGLHDYSEMSPSQLGGFSMAGTPIRDSVQQPQIIQSQPSNYEEMLAGVQETDQIVKNFVEKK